MALFRAGNKHDAESTLARTSALAEKDAVEGLASYHAAEGNRGEALRFLRRALLLDELDPMVAYNPNFASLHGDSEFQAIVAEVKKRSARPTR
jgi:hypothetical protein